jgi:YNFM family putative membrane transporter
MLNIRSSLGPETEPVSAKLRPADPPLHLTGMSLVTAPVDSLSRTGSSSQRPWSNIFAVFLCGTFAFLDLYCTQPLLPLLAGVFHASETRVSLTISASTLGVAVSAALLALFAERADRKRLIVASMVALALATALTATAGTLATLALWRLLQGLVTPGIFIITIAYITEEWPAAQVPAVMSVYVAGTVFGGFLGRVSGGLIGSQRGWQTVFVTLGLCGLVGAIATWQLLPPARARSAGSSSPFAPFVRNLRNPRLLATFLIGFCMLFTLVAVFSYITFYLTAVPFHLSTAQVSWLFSVYVFGLLATLAAGRVLGRFGLRHGMLAAVAFCLTGLALTLVHSVAVVAVGLAILSSGVFIAQTCANSFIRDASPQGSRVSAAGLYICSYYIGGTTGGLLPGLFWAHFAWPGTAALTAVVLVIAAFTTWFGWSTPVGPDPIPL